MRVKIAAVALLACSNANALPLTSRGCADIDLEGSKSVTHPDCRTEVVPLPETFLQSTDKTNAKMSPVDVQLDKRAKELLLFAGLIEAVAPTAGIILLSMFWSSVDLLVHGGHRVTQRSRVVHTQDNGRFESGHLDS